MISGFYLAVKPWSPEFYSEEEVFGSTMVWVRFYGLGIRYYHEKAMLRIAAAMGKPVKVDVATKMAARGKYARTCVEIDLGVPITRSVEVDGRVLDVEYESLELVCNMCGCYGHVGVDCKLISSISANIDETRVNEDKEQDHEKMDQVPFSSNIEKPFVFGSATIGIEKNKDKEVHVIEGAHAGDTTWTKVERKAKGKKVFLGEPAMKGINGVESSLHLSKGNQVLKQARNFKLASSGFTSAQGVTGGKQGPGSEWAGAYSQGAETSKMPFRSNLKRLRPNSLQNSPVENGHTWNVRGARNKLAWVHLKQLKLRGIVDVFGCSRSAWLGVSCNVVAASSQVVCVEFSNNSFSWVCASIYASPVPSIREEVWRVLTDFSRNYSGPLLAIGDFNEILLSSEVKGGNFVSQRAERFGALLDECGLIDLGAHGSLYTWFRHMQGNRFISKRLDKVVATDAWCFCFSESYVENLARMHSDHCPIMVRCQGNDRRVGVKPFRFQVAWSYHPSFLSVVRGAWDKGPNPIRCLSQVELDVMGDQELPSLSREAIESLTRNVSKEEVRKVVMGMNSFKAPGADGFQAFFFKEYWEVVGTEVWELVKKAFVGFDLDSALFDTLVVLIPKVDNPSRMKEFCPISLCNVIYKIITKVVVERLRPFLQDIIGPLQGGFIPGRGAPNNIIVAQEVLHFMKKTKSKKGVLAFKIDLEKAYDRSSSLSLMWNGNRLDGFQPKRGLRQGDPMSPYLFVICMERLSCLIARASGMKVNFDKSRAICSMNVSRQRKDLFTGISSIRFANSLGKYLGVPLKHGRVTKADFNDVVDKLTNRLASWKGHFLNKAGRICLAKSVLSSIPIYRMQVSLFPSASVLKEGFVWEVGALSKNFWFDSWLHSGPVRARVEFLDICEAALTIEDVYRDGVWHLERIYSFIPRDLREDILSLVYISASGRDLGWSWEHTLYSAKQGYLWLIQNKLNWDRNINWLWLWKARVPEKLRLLVWLCLHDAVPTQYLRFWRYLSSSSLCTRCNQLPETIFHCFRDCEVVRSVWVSLGFSDVCFFGSHEVHDWFKHGLLNEGCSKFAAIIWSIWQDRNMDNFQGVFRSAGSIAHKARRCMMDFEYTTQNRVCCIQGLKPLSWSLPEPGAWKLNCDGSVNLGDNCAGFGWVIRNSSSQWVMGCSGNSFGSSVIKMELWSIWKGLAWALEAGLKLVVCETDCAVTFELVTGWQVLL
nr:uncharacterized protein LOC114925975 [Arachis hypogaea]